MNEQVDNALGGHGMDTVTSTQVGAVKDYTRLINAAHQVVNKHSDSVQWYEETHVDSLRELDDALESLDAVSEPLYTRDELVEIMAKAGCNRPLKQKITPAVHRKKQWHELSLISRTRLVGDMEAAINALLATGQLKVRE